MHTCMHLLNTFVSSIITISILEIRNRMQKKGVMVGLIFVLLLLIFNILKDLKSDIVFLKLSSDNSLMTENSSIQKTAKCENFGVSVNMLHHPCGPTIKKNPGFSVTLNLTHSEQSIDRMKNFEKIYEIGIWKSHGESKSGLGSTKANTRQILKILHNVVDFLKIELQQDRIR